METHNQQFNNFGFQLKKITTEQFDLIEDAYDESCTEVNLGFGFKFGLNEKERMIAAYVKVQFEQAEKPFILLELAHHYLIEPSSWEQMKSEEHVTLPKNIATHLAALTIGSIRGMLHCKTEDTPFNNFVLPTINVNELLKEDVVMG